MTSLTSTKYPPRLKLLPRNQYRGVNDLDPIKYYYLPIFGKMYRKRVEICLAECTGGHSIPEIGFGTGLTFLNLHEQYQEIFGLDLTASVEEVKGVFEPLGIRTDLMNGNVLSMTYSDCSFDTVLLISILEHLQPVDLTQAFSEIRRVLKPGGQLVYGVPIERPLMVFLFRLLGHNIRDEHFSTEEDVLQAAKKQFERVSLQSMRSVLPMLGPVYVVGHFIKKGS